MGDEYCHYCKRPRTDCHDVEDCHRTRLSRELESMRAERDKYYDEFVDALKKCEKVIRALVISRGQWIHSINARQCMEALGESEEAIKRQEEANIRLDYGAKVIDSKENNHG